MSTTSITSDGLILDVYPVGWDAPLETFTVWDDDVPATDAENQSAADGEAA